MAKAVTLADGHTALGANYVYSASGLYDDLKHSQAGELYIDALGEVTATGFFKYPYAIADIPRVQITPVYNPSGFFWISASGEEKFTVTFQNAPVTDAAVPTPKHVANWLAVL